VTELVHRVRPAAGEPAGALVLLHGRGADESDLHPLLDLLDPQRRLVGLTPGGPLFLPPGGRHWYVVPRVGHPDPDSFRGSYELLERDVPELTGVPWERTVVGGFSQGSVMAYAVGLGAGRPTPAGIVAMSGFIPTVEGWTADVDRPGLPVWIAHGRRDPVIGVEFGRAARDALAASPVDLTYHEHEGAHHVDPRLLAELPGWVDRAVDRAVAATS
jgi:phospholipase/carboxylesterase